MFHGAILKLKIFTVKGRGDTYLDARVRRFVLI